MGDLLLLQIIAIVLCFILLINVFNLSIILIIAFTLGLHVENSILYWFSFLIIYRYL